MDWITALATLAHSASRIAIGGVRSAHGPNAVPSAVEELTPQYLDRVMSSTDAPSSQPRSRVAAIEHIGGHSGTAARDRVAIRYEEASTSDDHPPVLFVKHAPADFANSLFAHLMGLGANEVRFYQMLAPDIPASVPRTWGADMSRDAVRFWILLEDLEARGCGFRKIGEEVELEFAERVMSAMAAYHARFWESERFAGDLAWLPRRGADPPYVVARPLCRLAHKPAIRRYPELIPPGFAERMALIYERRDALEDVWAEAPLTLIHGDPHIGNLYVEPDGAPGFLDWQMVRLGQGVRDVAHFIITSLEPAARREREASLLKHYVAKLAEHGVANFGLERAREQYRLHTLYEWFAASVTAAAGNLQPDSVMRAGVTRAVAAIEDWDALDALAKL